MHGLYIFLLAAGLADLTRRLDRERFDVLVLLGTGAFPDLRSRMVLVDGLVAALARPGRRIGVLVPAAARIETYAPADGSAGRRPSPRMARPMWRPAFGKLSAGLTMADLIVMHCMGYDRAMRERVAELSGKPALLGCSLVAMAVAQLALVPIGSLPTGGPVEEHVGSRSALAARPEIA